MTTKIIALVFSHFSVALACFYFVRKQNKINQPNASVKNKEFAPKLQTNDNSETTEKLVQAELEISNLKHQLKQKSIELAKQVKDGEDKGRILTLLKEKLNEAEYNPKINKAYWSEMDRLLSIHLENNDKGFEIQMDELHQDFINNLHKKFPELSVYDLRLCAYLKIGMNSKEISELLRVLPSSINVSRSRIRKKMGLSHEQDLFHVLNEIGK
ncbi:MAG: hypothetical protein KDC49_14740 [Saprospiraceae bacterium]|nr:hypothetical protein [Saprospiraceae bacterium]